MLRKRFKKDRNVSTNCGLERTSVVQICCPQREIEASQGVGGVENKPQDEWWKLGRERNWWSGTT